MGKRRINHVVRASLILALLLTVAPIVAATTAVMADFTVGGTVRLPLDNEITVTPVAGLLSDTAQIQFVLTTPWLRICEWSRYSPQLEIPSFNVTAPPTQTNASCYPLTQVRIELAPDGDHAGWLGFYPKSGARLEIGSDSFETRSLSTLASPGARVASNSFDPPDWPYYYQRVPGVHLLFDATGEMHYNGPGALKVKGPDMIVASAENTTRHDTHSRTSSDAALREREERWLYLEFDDAAIEMQAVAPFVVASRQAAGTWDGRLSLADAEGSVNTRSGEYRFAGGDGWIDGSFSGAFVPLQDEQVRLTFEGEMRATSFQAAARVPGQPGQASFPWVPIVIGVAVVGGAILAFRERRPRPKPVQLAPARIQEEEGRAVLAPTESAVAENPSQVAESYARRAQEAAEEGRWTTAVDLLKCAIHLAPVGRYYMDEGALLLGLGRVAEARERFAHAAEILTDGEAEMKAAECALCEPRADVDTAALWLERALERPDLAARVLSVIAIDSLFAVVRRHEAVRAALAAALRRRQEQGWERR